MPVARWARATCGERGKAALGPDVTWWARSLLWWRLALEINVVAYVARQHFFCVCW